MNKSREQASDILKKVASLREEIFHEIENRNGICSWHLSTLKNVKKIIIILASPRSGSSMLHALLRKHQSVISLSGENVPFFRLNGLSPVNAFDDSVHENAKNLISSQDRFYTFSRDLISDMTLPLPEFDWSKRSEQMPLIKSDFIDRLILRFSLQWIQIDFKYKDLYDLCSKIFGLHLKENKNFIKEIFYINLLKTLRDIYHEINPYYYDIPENLIKSFFPEIKIPQGPPNESYVIEETPFILLSPGKRITEKDFDDKFLLLKSSIDTYRISFIKALFPNAHIQYIFLTRNPAASINGIYDGWNHQGYFSHNLKNLFDEKPLEDKCLNIPGYDGMGEWQKWWWNFDLPPGWENYRNKPLEEVCVFQWISANQTIVKFFESEKISYFHARYEKLIDSTETRIKHINEILEFVSLDSQGAKNLDIEEPPLVLVTKPPVPFRWKKRSDLIIPLLKQSVIVDLCNKLGYNLNEIENWK